MSRKPSFFVHENSGIAQLKFIDGVSDSAEEFVAGAPKDNYSLFFSSSNFTDLRFLEPIKGQVQSVFTNDVQQIDWVTLHTFENLSTLQLGETLQSSFEDIVSFKFLETLDCFSASFMKDQGKYLDSLVALRIRKYENIDLEYLRNYKDLKRLSIIHSRKLESLNGIDELRDLLCLELDSNTSLRDISAVAACNALTTAVVVTNNKIENYEEIGKLARLEELIFTSSKVELASLNWLASLQKLQLLRFDCTVQSGDLSCLEQLKSLKHIHFKPKKNFNRKPADFILRDDISSKGISKIDLNRVKGIWQPFYR